MNDFFISHTGADVQWAEWIAWTLEEAGYPVILDIWDFRPGRNFVLEMQKALDSRTVIAVVSDAYIHATYTHPEWAAAFARDPQGTDRALIPVRVVTCKPTGLLKTTIAIDLVGLTEDAARTALIQGVSETVRPTEKPAFPGSVTAHSKKAGPRFPGPVREKALARPPAPKRRARSANNEHFEAQSWRPVWIFVAIVLALLALLIWQAPRIRRFDLGVVTTLVYAFFGLAAAYVLYRILHSKGLVKGSLLGMKYEFGGPAAVVVFFAVVGFSSRGTQPFTAQFELNDVKTAVRAPVSGRVELTLQSRMLFNITDGYGALTGIPSKYRGASVRITDRLEGWSVIDHLVRLDDDRAIPIRVARIEDPKAASDLKDISAVPNGPGWPNDTIRALSRIDAASLDSSDVTILENEYDKGTRKLRQLLEQEAANLTDEKNQNVHDILLVLVQMHRLIRVPQDWNDTYDLLKGRRPMLLRELHISKQGLSTSGDRKR